MRTIKGAAFALVLCSLALHLAASPATARPALPPWRADPPFSTETATVTVGEHTIDAEIADTGPLRTRGLSYRSGLAPGTGMLFVFEAPSVRSFWMRGMEFCLDIIWIEDGRIVGAAENACPMPGVAEADLPRYVSPSPVSYVLEVPANWLRDRGYGPGTPVSITFPDSAQASPEP